MGRIKNTNTHSHLKMYTKIFAAALVACFAQAVNIDSFEATTLAQRRGSRSIGGRGGGGRGDPEADDDGNGVPDVFDPIDEDSQCEEDVKTDQLAAYDQCAEDDTQCKRDAFRGLRRGLRLCNISCEKAATVYDKKLERCDGDADCIIEADRWYDTAQINCEPE